MSLLLNQSQYFFDLIGEFIMGCLTINGTVTSDHDFLVDVYLCSSNFQVSKTVRPPISWMEQSLMQR